MKKLLDNAEKLYEEVASYKKYDLSIERKMIDDVKKSEREKELYTEERFQNAISILEGVIGLLNNKNISCKASIAVFNIDSMLNGVSFNNNGEYIKTNGDFVLDTRGSKIRQLADSTVELLELIKGVEIDISLLEYIFSVVYKVIKAEFKFENESEVLCEVRKDQIFQEHLAQFVKNDLKKIAELDSLDSNIIDVSYYDVIRQLLIDALLNEKRMVCTDDNFISTIVNILHSQEVEDKNVIRMDRYGDDILDVVDDMNEKTALLSQKSEQVKEIADKYKSNLSQIRKNIVALLLSATVLTGVTVNLNNGNIKAVINDDKTVNDLVKFNTIHSIINILISSFGTYSLLGLSKELRFRKATKRDLDIIKEETQKLRVSLESSKEEGNEKRRLLEELMEDFRTIYMFLSDVDLESSLSASQEVLDEYDKSISLADNALEAYDEMLFSKKQNKSLKLV